MSGNSGDMEVVPPGNAVPEGGMYEAPQGELEQAIAVLWKELFHLDKVSRNDNFFELGGNSLLGMDLSEMLSSRLAIQLPVLLIFQQPTVRELAAISTASL